MQAKRVGAKSVFYQELIGEECAQLDPLVLVGAPLKRSRLTSYFRKIANLDDNGTMDETEKPHNPAAALPPAAPPSGAAESGSSFDPRRRLRELLSVPESQRTDPQWDEIIELEVQLAPGNRIGSEMPRGNDRGQGQKGGGSGGGGAGGGGNWKRGPGTRKHSKPGGRKPGPSGAT